MSSHNSIKISILSAAVFMSLAACTASQDPHTGDSSPAEDTSRAQNDETKKKTSIAGKLALQKRERDEELSQQVKPAAAPSVVMQESARSSIAGRQQSDQAKHRSSSQGFAQPVPPQLRPPSEPLDRENYAHFDENPVKQPLITPVSTFSIDIDTGAYANVRRFLSQGRMPNQDAVRVEEMINYFSYDYQTAKNREQPFGVMTEMAPTPWNTHSYLLHIGIKGDDMLGNTLPASNLVFLIDVSGSMRSPNKLDLLKTSLKLLTKQLRSQDRISLVVYAGASGVVLPPTSGDQRAVINNAIDNLVAGGSTNGAAGIRLAYSLAEQAFIKNGINRILLATDGDFNVGTVNFEALKDLIEEKRQSGISLTTLGFGTGNYNDHLMEQLADAGNGNYAYIDTLNEAQKVLVDEQRSTLQTIAKDVKIQIEFNPATVAEYRLIGYENRALKREDFNNDKVDAGEIGAGHSVTALYEVVLTDSPYRQLDKLRYQSGNPASNTKRSDEIALLRLRYKQPDSDSSKLIEHVIHRTSIKHAIQQASNNFRFAAAVAAFGQQLRGGQYTKSFSMQDTLQLARAARGKDPFGYRGEFLRLVNLAQSLSHEKPQTVKLLR